MTASRGRAPARRTADVLYCDPLFFPPAHHPRSNPAPRYSSDGDFPSAGLTLGTLQLRASSSLAAWLNARIGDFVFIEIHQEFREQAMSRAAFPAIILKSAS